MCLQHEFYNHDGVIVLAEVKTAEGSGIFFV
jgi:hypothetical protein